MRKSGVMLCILVISILVLSVSFISSVIAEENVTPESLEPDKQCIEGETKNYVCEDGKWIIHKTIITDIKPLTYFEKVLG